MTIVPIRTESRLAKVPPVVLPPQIFSVYLPPPPQCGIHSAIFKTASILRDAGSSPGSALDALFAWRQTYQFRRPVTDQEIKDAWQAVFLRSRIGATQKSGHSAKTAFVPRWPIANPHKRSELVPKGFGLVDLWEHSPIRFEDTAPHTRFILERLFPDDPLLCLGWTMSQFDTRHLSEWTSPESMQFLTPSPMIARAGARKSDGFLSAHTLANTGARRFLVVDFDDPSGLDSHAAAAWYLSTQLPLALVLHSGGKGLHAWFWVNGLSDDELIPFFRLACEFGGDKALWTRSQFARIPDGTRDNGRPQRVYYFNPEVLK